MLVNSQNVTLVVVSKAADCVSCYRTMHGVSVLSNLTFA